MRLFNGRAPLSLLALLLAVMLGAGAAGAQDDLPRISEVDCWFDVPAGDTIECGVLTVPAARDADGQAIVDAGTMDLAFAVFRTAADDAQPDPIVYLEGGPGGNALQAAALIFNSRFRIYAQDRDLIIFDQRGTGYSQPALACPELTDLTFEMLDMDLSREQSLEISRDVLVECRDRLVAEGADLASFNSRESASDLNDLRQALGYDEWNVLGVSYGTRLALTAMRDHPEGIRSVVLDSAYPLQADLYQDVIYSADRAFRKLFDGCTADAACAAAYPDLEARFYTLVDKLNETPAAMQITNPANGETYDAIFNGDGLIGLVFQMLYQTNIIPTLPLLIDQIDREDYTTLALLQGSLLQNLDFVSIGQQLSVQCHEEASFPPPDARDRADIPAQLQAAFDYAATLGPAIYTVCDSWQAGAADPIENHPVSSDIPTLVLMGEYDPITPPTYGESVHESLSSSYLFQFPGYGHGLSLTGSGCPVDMVLAFFDNPTEAPDASCIDSLSAPAFELPAGELVMVPYTSDSFPMSGVFPEGWTEVSPGVFSGSALSATALLQQAIPGTADGFAELLTAQLRLDAFPESVGTRASEHFTWTLYQIEVQGLVLDVALADADGVAYLVLLQTMPDVHDAQYEQIFLPSVDALAPAE
jgi:pimeloyl-ACP methyl ester carboxylesterase